MHNMDSVPQNEWFDTYKAGPLTKENMAEVGDDASILLTQDEASAIEATILKIRKTSRRAQAEREATDTRRMQIQLWKMSQGQGWVALGHKTFNAWATDKFKASREHYWRLLRNVEMNIQVNGSFPETTAFIYRGLYADDKKYIPECHTRFVTVLPKARWKACWEEVKAVAATKTYDDERAQKYHAGQIRVPDIKEVVARFKRMFPVVEEADEFAEANRQKALRFTGKARPRTEGEMSFLYEPSSGRVRLFDSNDNPTGYLHPDDLFSMASIFAQTAPPQERALLLRTLQDDLGGK